VRFWYIATKQSGKTQMTDVYQYKYFGPPYWGITISTPTYDKSGNFIGTFGINVRIDFLRHLIENITISPNGRIFIVTDDGQIVAYPKASQYLSPQLLNIHNFSNGAVSKSFDIYSATKNTLFSFNLDGENYLATYKPLPGFGGHTWYLGIVVPTQDFIGTLMRANFITMGLGLLILILGILLVSEIISRIVKPLRSLANETRKIKHFELSGDTKVHSRIKEVVYLADSLQDMKKGLRLFQKYVPASLVRQLIEAGEDAQVGGSKRQLVTLFTDIEHFTTISERLDPHQLMTYMCKYLDELSKIILEERGTIDKYIGDSIMAFWGAPLPEEEPCQQAARSALRCQKRLHELNTQWEKQAIPAFKTRIGIHMGEAIVGNLGSSERFNYTAIGDSINTASRLEGANKIYQTQIVVSETVYQQIKNQFYVRLLDFVSLLGRDEPLYIYELMAEKNETLSFDFDQYVRTFSKAFAHYQQQQWDEAIVSFDQCVKIYPSDQLASIYIARCKEFKINPPSSEWHGAWTIRGK
jgi:adenylate cyclase